MRHRAFQFLSLLAVVIAAVWFVVSPDFEPVIAAVSGLAALILAVGATSSSRPKSTTGRPLAEEVDPRSIAVLPFASLSSDTESELFADGMTDEIISAVSNMPDFRVIARTSAFAFKGTSQDVREIGAQLGVATVLEGSVRREGNRLRVTAQLVDAGGGHHLWSERYDRELTDVFEIQDEIAGVIASRLGPRGSAAGRRTDPTDDLEAYQSYLRGMFFYWQYSSEGAARALACFHTALGRDPDYALAHAGASLAHTWLSGFGHEATDSTPEKARASAQKALALEPDLPEGLMSLAEALHYLDWDFDGARRLVSRAIELSPSSVFARMLHSFCLRVRRQFDDAVSELETVVALDPLAVAAHNELGNAYLAAGRDEEAEAQIARTLRLNSEFAPTLETAGWVHLRAGRLTEALAVFESLPPGRLSTMAALGFTLASLGRTDEARAQLGALQAASRNRRVTGHVDMARVHAGLGEFDQATQHLERAIETKAIPAILLGSSVRDWGEFRQDPRFAQLVLRVENSGLPTRGSG